MGKCQIEYYPKKGSNFLDQSLLTRNFVFSEKENYFFQNSPSFPVSDLSAKNEKDENENENDEEFSQNTGNKDNIKLFFIGCVVVVSFVLTTRKLRDPKSQKKKNKICVSD